MKIHFFSFNFQVINEEHLLPGSYYPATTKNNIKLFFSTSATDNNN